MDPRAGLDDMNRLPPLGSPTRSQIIPTTLSQLLQYIFPLIETASLNNLTFNKNKDSVVKGKLQFSVGYEPCMRRIFPTPHIHYT
jgi:hypothetical protein